MIYDLYTRMSNRKSMKKEISSLRKSLHDSTLPRGMKDFLARFISFYMQFLYFILKCPHFDSVMNSTKQIINMLYL